MDICKEVQQLSEAIAKIDYLFQEGVLLSESDVARLAYVAQHLTNLVRDLSSQQKEKIQLCGFGDFSEDEEEKKDFVKVAIKHHCVVIPTYYDHTLIGEEKDVEAVTMEMWSMPKDQWGENCLEVI